jgi:prefoldin subunit 5
MLIESDADLRRELAGQVETAADALRTLQALESKETFDPGDRERWVTALNAINIARVKFGEAAEALHEKLNDYADMLADLEQEAAELPSSEKGRE